MSLSIVLASSSSTLIYLAVVICFRRNVLILDWAAEVCGILGVFHKIVGAKAEVLGSQQDTFIGSVDGSWRSKGKVYSSFLVICAGLLLTALSFVISSIIEMPPVVSVIMETTNVTHFSISVLLFVPGPYHYTCCLSGVCPLCSSK